jgi:hypothetical protein
MLFKFLSYSLLKQMSLEAGELGQLSLSEKASLFVSILDAYWTNQAREKSRCLKSSMRSKVWAASSLSLSMPTRKCG